MIAGFRRLRARRIILISAMWPKSTTSSTHGSRKRKTQSMEALRGLGHGEAADHYTHFSYEMVALTPRCAAELGYNLSEEDKTRLLHRGQRAQGFWREGRRSAGPAHRFREEGSRFAASATERAGAPGDRHADRHRRAALLHAEVHQAVGDRFRFQRSAQLRRRDRTLRAICRGAGHQHLPQGGSRSRDFLGRRRRPSHGRRSGEFSKRRRRQRNLGTVAGLVQNFVS